MFSKVKAEVEVWQSDSGSGSCSVAISDVKCLRSDSAERLDRTPMAPSLTDTRAITFICGAFKKVLKAKK